MAADEIDSVAPFRLGPVKNWELYAYGFARTVVHMVNKAAWRVVIEGEDRLPPGSFILAPVHRSNIDTPLVASLTTRRLRYMGKDGVWKYRISGAILTALGGFPVHRELVDREAIRRCIAVLTNGEPLVLFPEGTRKSGPVVEGIFEGAAYIAMKANVPIVPVGIGGSERAWGKGSKFPRFTKIALVVGEPIYPPESSGKSGNKIPRSSLAKVSLELTEALQSLFNRAQERVGIPAGFRRS